MKSKLKLKFRVGDLVQFLEEDSCADEHDDYGIVIKIKKLTDDFGNNKSYNHYGIFWIVNNETTFEGWEWADKTLKLLARGKNK